MQLVELFQQRIGRPEDSETVARQKAVGTVMTVLGVAAIIGHLIFWLFAGIAPYVRLNIALLPIYLVLILLVLIAPRFYTILAVGFGLVTIGGSFAAQVLGGGYGSGLWAFAYTLITPVLVYFAAGRRAALFIFVVAEVAYFSLAALEPMLDSYRLALPTWSLAVFNTFVITVATVMMLGFALDTTSQLEQARARADALLLNILPAPIAARLKRDPAPIADGFDDVTILFADIVGFTPTSADADPVAVVGFLNDLFSDFDDLAAHHGLEKIKTIGDAYMVAGGLPEPRPDHCQSVAAFAIDMLEAAGRRRFWNGEPVRLRVGINCGPVVAGVIGRRKFSYDLWGDAVNTASRMESNGLVNVIQVTAAVKERLQGLYAFEAREPIAIKGKGMMETYILRPPPGRERIN